MTVADWVAGSRRDIRDHGVLQGSKFAVEELAVGAGRRVGKRLNYGESYWGRDWDVLVLLDACRWDLMQDVAPAWEFIPQDVPATYSPGSMSAEWLEKHATPDRQSEMQDTALVSANAFTRLDCVQPAQWAVLDEVWKHSWDPDEGTVQPRPVTDAAIHHWHESDPDQMIVWYLQPHAPFIPVDWSEGFVNKEFGDGATPGRSEWYKYRDGDLSREQLWDGYRKNLNYVLEDVELLLENVDADDVVISSDHANCLGEFGVYGHPKHVPVPSLKRVPWIETSGVDEETHRPGHPAGGFADVTEQEVEERLTALGYK